MGKQPQDGVDKLSALLPGGAPPQESQEPEPLTEEQVEEKMKLILASVSKEADEDVFLMQELLTACSGEIQAQIREMFFEDPEADNG